MFLADFALVAKKNSTRPAAVYKDEYISYSEIDYKSSQVASFLKQQNVERGMVIGYYGERTIEVLIAILGIWKAGAVYMPVDPALPFERKRIICEQSGARLFLTDNREALDFIDCVSIGDILQEQQVILDFNGESDKEDDENVAYLIFTSGTTGIPKGAMVTHPGMYNHLKVKRIFLDFMEDTRLAQTANISFDISIWQLVLPLMIGGTVFFVRDSEIMNYKRLTTYILTKNIQILEIVPSYLEHWMKYLKERNITLDSLKYLFVTGEAFNPSLANESLKFFKGIKIVNAYGPAEAADDVTHYILDSNVCYDNVPLGTSIKGMRVDILDERRNVLPAEVKGLIYVTGVGVGIGYINDQKKTADNFFDGLIIPGERSYNTGDTGYIGKDGLLYFCGRLNNQIKICGHRIELEEIETRLELIDYISEAVVEAQEELASGKKRLVAYIRLLQTGAIPEKQNLELELAKVLPYYMIPKEFYICNEFPLSGNGKVDRKNVYKYITDKIA